MVVCLALHSLSTTSEVDVPTRSKTGDQLAVSLYIVSIYRFTSLYTS